METELSVLQLCCLHIMVSHTQFDCHHGDRTQCGCMSYSCAVYTLMVSHTQFDCHHGCRTQCGCMSYSCAVYTLWCPILSLIATMDTELSVAV
jgi:hypothetical protein